MADLVHGTAIAVAGRAVLLRGPSGAGKSDLALRCMALAPGGLVRAAPELIADDQVLISERERRLWVAAPDTIAGLIEVRGVGIVRVPWRREAELCLVADLVAANEIDRLPDRLPDFEHGSCSVPRLRLAAFEASAPLKLVLGLEAAAGAER